MSEEKKKTLTKVELRNLSESHDKHTMKQKDIEIARLRIEKAEGQLNLLSAQYTLKSKEIEELKRSQTKEQKEFSELKSEHKKLTDKIGEKYNLGKNWGFSPLTGEFK